MDDPLKLQVAEKAERIVEQFRDRSNDLLDFSEASLTIVEELLAETARFREDMPEDQIAALVELLGCYVLEVGQREFGGRYYWYDDRKQPVLVVGEPAYRVALLAFDKIRGRISGDETDNVPYFYQGFAERARNPTPGDDVLYV